MIESMKARLEEARAEYQKLAEQARKDQAWANLPTMVVWEVIRQDLASAAELLKEACVAKDTTVEQWRDDAAEARVYSRLLARPERGTQSLEALKPRIASLEAEIRDLEMKTKGA